MDRDLIIYSLRRAFISTRESSSLNTIPGSIVPKSVEPDNGGLVRALGPHHMRSPVLERPLRTCIQCIFIPLHSIPPPPTP